MQRVLHYIQRRISLKEEEKGWQRKTEIDDFFLEGEWLRTTLVGATRDEVIYGYDIVCRI